MIDLIKQQLGFKEIAFSISSHFSVKSQLTQVFDAVESYSNFFHQLPNTKHENKNTQNIIITTLASPSKEFFIWPHEASLKNKH